MPLIDATTRGVHVIAVTPFAGDGALDLDSLDRVTDLYLGAGAEGLTILGMMGEAPKLTQAESRAVAARVIARAGGRPVVVGVSAPGLAAIGELTRAVMDLGAAGVMVAPPASLRTDESILGYYALVAETAGAGVPLVVQDFPLASGVQISPATFGRIVAGVPQVVMLKHEDWPGLAKITAIRAAEAAGQRRVSILCGNGGLFLDFETERGADGAMTGYAFADMLVDVVRLAAAGQRDAAHDLFDAHLPLMRYEQQPGVGLAVRKWVLLRRGLLASDRQRSPAAAMSAAARQEVGYLLQRLARIDARAAGLAA